MTAMPREIMVVILSSPADGPDGFDVFTASQHEWATFYADMNWDEWDYCISSFY